APHGELLPPRALRRLRANPARLAGGAASDCLRLGGSLEDRCAERPARLGAVAQDGPALIGVAPGGLGGAAPGLRERATVGMCLQRSDNAHQELWIQNQPGRSAAWSVRGGRREHLPAEPTSRPEGISNLPAPSTCLGTSWPRWPRTVTRGVTGLPGSEWC